MTGATSFVGTHLLLSLIKEGYSIIALKRPSTEPTIANDLIEWVNISDIERRFELHENIHAIIHIATDYGRDGTSILEQYKCNVLLPARLLELMPTIKSKLFISTDSFSESMKSSMDICGRIWHLKDTLWNFRKYM